MTHEQKNLRWIGKGEIGTEIGPGTSPVPGLDPPAIYVDCFQTFAARPRWRARADADMFRLRSRSRARPMLQDDPRPFAEWAGRSNGHAH